MKQVISLRPDTKPHTNFPSRKKNIWGKAAGKKHVGLVIWEASRINPQGGNIWEETSENSQLVKPWWRLAFLGITWEHLGSLGIINDHPVQLSGTDSDHLESSGMVRDHLSYVNSSGIIWDDLRLFGIIRNLVNYLGELWKPLWRLLENCWKNCGALECLNHWKQWFHYISAKTQTVKCRYHITMNFLR